MELVDDDHIERVRWDRCDVPRAQRLDGGEHVRPLSRHLARQPELTEGAIGQDLAVRTQGLVEDLLAMSEEQQPQRACRPAGEELLVVERCDDGLARACRRDDQVPMPTMHLPLDLERLEHLGLVRVGTNRKARQLSLIHISEPTRRTPYLVCRLLLEKKK